MHYVRGSLSDPAVTQTGGWSDTPGEAGGGDATGGQYAVDARTAGTVTATLTWVPASGQTAQQDPPPATVVVQESATAATDGPDPAQDQASDGLGGGGSDTRYSVQDGSSGTITLSDGLSAGTPAAAGPPYTDHTAQASVSYSATAPSDPLALQLTGPVNDGDGDLDILIGQHCSACISGLPTFPSEWTTIYSWSVSGTTFQTWATATPAIGDDPANPNASYYVPGPSPLTNPTASWYWNDLRDAMEVVSCDITITPPPGQGQPLYISLAKAVDVFVPLWQATGTGGYVKIGYHTTSSSLEILATGTSDQADNGDVSGMNWAASVESPLPTLFGDGYLEVAQLVIPNATYVDPDGTPVYCFDYGTEGLDGGFPYGWDVTNNGPHYTSGDSSGFGLVDLVMTAVILKHEFEDYLMYLPPGNAQCVPVAHFVWSVDGSATHPTTGKWSDYASQHGGSDSAGTVPPSGTAVDGTDTEFLASNPFPEWTQIDQPGFQPN